MFMQRFSCQVFSSRSVCHIP